MEVGVTGGGRGGRGGEGQGQGAEGTGARGERDRDKGRKRPLALNANDCFKVQLVRACECVAKHRQWQRPVQPTSVFTCSLAVPLSVISDCGISLEPPPLSLFHLCATHTCCG